MMNKNSCLFFIANGIKYHGLKYKVQLRLGRHTLVYVNEPESQLKNKLETLHNTKFKGN